MHAANMPQVEKRRPSRKTLLELFCDMATEVVERDFHHALESMRIDELVIDSLGMLEIIGALERRLQIQLPDEDLVGLQTIGDLLDVVERSSSVSFT